MGIAGPRDRSFDCFVAGSLNGPIAVDHSDDPHVGYAVPSLTRFERLRFRRHEQRREVDRRVESRPDRTLGVLSLVAIADAAARRPADAPPWRTFAGGVAGGVVALSVGGLCAWSTVRTYTAVNGAVEAVRHGISPQLDAATPFQLWSAFGGWAVATGAFVAAALIVTGLCWMVRSIRDGLAASRASWVELDGLVESGIVGQRARAVLYLDGDVAVFVNRWGSSARSYEYDTSVRVAVVGRSLLVANNSMTAVERFVAPSEAVGATLRSEHANMGRARPFGPPRRRTSFSADLLETVERWISIPGLGALVFVAFLVLGAPFPAMVNLSAEVEAIGEAISASTRFEATVVERIPSPSTRLTFVRATTQDETTQDDGSLWFLRADAPELGTSGLIARTVDGSGGAGDPVLHDGWLDRSVTQSVGFDGAAMFGAVGLAGWLGARRVRALVAPWQRRAVRWVDTPPSEARIDAEPERFHSVWDREHDGGHLEGPDEAGEPFTAADLRKNRRSQHLALVGIASFAAVFLAGVLVVDRPNAATESLAQGAQRVAGTIGKDSGLFEWETQLTTHKVEILGNHFRGEPVTAIVPVDGPAFSVERWPGAGLDDAAMAVALLSLVAAFGMALWWLRLRSRARSIRDDLVDDRRGSGATELPNSSAPNSANVMVRRRLVTAIVVVVVGVVCVGVSEWAGRAWNAADSRLAETEFGQLVEATSGDPVEVYDEWLLSVLVASRGAGAWILVVGIVGIGSSFRLFRAMRSGRWAVQPGWCESGPGGALNGANVGGRRLVRRLPSSASSGLGDQTVWVLETPRGAFVANALSSDVEHFRNPLFGRTMPSRAMLSSAMSSVQSGPPISANTSAMPSSRLVVGLLGAMVCIVVLVAAALMSVAHMEREVQAAEQARSLLPGDVVAIDSTPDSLNGDVVVTVQSGPTRASVLLWETGVEVGDDAFLWEPLGGPARAQVGSVLEVPFYRVGMISVVASILTALSVSCMTRVRLSERDPREV